MRKVIPIILVLLVTVSVAAQTNKGRIVGTVTTAEGLAVEGVMVTLSSKALIGSTMTTTTNNRGMYRFVLLPIGTYDLKLEKAGYSTVDQKGIVLDYDTTLTVDKAMQPSEFEQVVVITGEGPVVDKTSSGIGDKLDTAFLENMPNQRDIWDMPNLTAGFTNDSALPGCQRPHPGRRDHPRRSHQDRLRPR